MFALQAQQKRTKSKKKPAKKPKKKPARPVIKKVIMRRQPVIDPYVVYQPEYYHGYNPYHRPVHYHSNPQYNYYQQRPVSHVRQISAAVPEARSIDPVTLAERVRAESAALRAHNANVGVRLFDGGGYAEGV